PKSVTVSATPAPMAKVAAIPTIGVWAAIAAISTKIDPTHGRTPDANPVARICEVLERLERVNMLELVERRAWNCSFLPRYAGSSSDAFFCDLIDRSSGTSFTAPASSQQSRRARVV